MEWVTNHLQIKGDRALEVLQSLLTKTVEYVQEEPEEQGSKEAYEIYFNLWGDKSKFTFIEQLNTYERAGMEAE